MGFLLTPHPIIAASPVTSRHSRRLTASARRTSSDVAEVDIERQAASRLRRAPLTLAVGGWLKRSSRRRLHAAYETLDAANSNTEHQTAGITLAAPQTCRVR